uniref:Protein white n=1 Tax=Tigriopus japonicus TaxID=158387 RepID=A0A0A7ARE3_TIGJA|nr:ATP-binding cassette transporter sub-family G 125057 [Tigriopus japonicus]
MENKGFSEVHYGGNDDVVVKINRSSSIATAEEDQITFTWDDLSVSAVFPGSKIPFKKSEKKIKQIVKQASGYVKPGELVAIMGASGAGKSTLLNALTFRNLDGLDLTGTRYANGVPISPNSLTSVSAYIQQDDLFIGTLTPREHLEFQALVRMDREIPYKARMARVDSVLHELGLTKCAKTVIGVPGRIKGISGGEMKRLAFASEVLTNPALLFCDEPTSGLDSYMAQNVVEVLQQLANQGKSIICTIHQPSSQVFSMFDRVLLMAEGQVTYLGGVRRAFEFFSDVGHPCPEHFNPADHYVQVLAVTPGDEESCRQRIKRIADAFETSPEGRSVVKEVNYQKQNKHASNQMVEASKKSSPYKASWIEQFRALLWRSFLSVMKEPMIVKVNLIQTIVISLILGIIYMNQEYDQKGASNINGALFIIITNLNFSNVFGVVNVFCLELPIFMREHFNGSYRVDTYFLTKQLAELPVYIIMPIVFVSIFYWLVGLNPDGGRFVIAIVIAICLVQAVISFGYCVSCWASSVQMALAIAPPVMIPMLLFGGFFLNSDTVPVWLDWIQYISWFKYANEAFVVNQWVGVELSCPPDEIVELPDTFNISCNALGGNISNFCNNFADNGIISIPLNASATIDVPSPCFFDSGEAVIENLGFDKDSKVFNIIMLVVLAIAFRIIGFIGLLVRTRRKTK